MLEREGVTPDALPDAKYSFSEARSSIREPLQRSVRKRILYARHGNGRGFLFHFADSSVALKARWATLSYVTGKTPGDRISYRWVFPLRLAITRSEMARAVT